MNIPGPPVKFPPDGGPFVLVLLNDDDCLVPLKVILLVVEVSENDAKV